MKERSEYSRLLEKSGMSKKEIKKHWKIQHPQIRHSLVVRALAVLARAVFWCLFKIFRVPEDEKNDFRPRQAI